MNSFEDLGLSPELTEALAAEGIETPTPLQEAAVPIIAKGNNLVLVAGPGSGVFVAWVAPLLGRIDPSTDAPKALVLCATSETAERLAESASRLSSITGHSVAALGSAWALPERADVLFATPEALLSAMEAGTISVSDLESLVVDQAQLIEAGGSLDTLERLFAYLPSGTQRILSSLPISDAVQDVVDRHFKRTLTVPTPDTDVPHRGTVRFRIVPEPKEAGVLAVVDELIGDGARHVLVFCRSEDRAADVGDYLTLHGFVAGAPGDSSVPVWLGIDALQARAEAQGVEGLAVVSCDAPADIDTLDRRHSLTEGGVVVVLPRELAHLKALGKRTGYITEPFPPPARSEGALGRLRAMLARAIEEEDTAVWLNALEPLFSQHDPAEVAAAAVALMRRQATTAGVATPASETRQTAAARATGTPSWSKLFLGVGERDGLEKGDLLGAITGEAGVAGSSVGKIEIRESHSLVEVHDNVARAVIQALNGTTIKGRAVRVDFDRPRTGGPRRRSAPGR